MFGIKRRGRRQQLYALVGGSGLVITDGGGVFFSGLSLADGVQDVQPLVKLL